MRYTRRPAVVAAAGERHTALVAAGEIRCTCNALADPNNRHGAHAPDCELFTSWPDILEAAADDAYEADLARAEEVDAANQLLEAEHRNRDTILGELE